MDMRYDDLDINDIRHPRSQMIILLILAVVLIGHNIFLAHYPKEDIQPTPTLTGEYGNPDGWETLTGPYLDVQTVQIQELQKENDMLKEANRIIDGKLKSEKRCGDVQCGTIVWFIDGHTITSGRIVFYVDEEIKEGEIGGYEIQTEEQYHDEYYIGFNRILPKSDIYKSKNELLKTIKGM